MKFEYTVDKAKETMKQSDEASNRLLPEEIDARDKAFIVTPAVFMHEGWLWNICWDAARKYYCKDA